MARKFSDERDKKETDEKFNPYNLFLILILLILSQDVLQMIAQKLKKEKVKTRHKPSNYSDKKILNILPVHEKKETERTNREPKEEKKEND